MPVIARIHGFCFGAGLEIAAACDVRLASDTASFGMPEVKIGIPSVIEAALFPLLTGWGRAREILLLGETFSAREALAWGLVEHVVPATSLDQEVEAWIGKLLTSAPRAVRLQKRLIRQWEDLPLSGAIAAGIDAFAAAYETDEPRVAMRKFLAAQKARKNAKLNRHPRHSGDLAFRRQRSASTGAEHDEMRKREVHHEARQYGDELGEPHRQQQHLRGDDSVAVLAIQPRRPRPRTQSTRAIAACVRIRPQR